MAGVTDVSGGMHYLLQNDDLVMLQVRNQGGVVTTSLVTANTENSKLSGTPHATTISNSYPNGNFDPTGGAVASEAVGRMYNTKSDMLAVLNAIDNGTQSPTNWLLSLFDPLSGFQNATQLSSRFRPGGTVFTRVVMGDFNGDGLADPLVFYASVRKDQPTEWGMKVFTAEDPKTEAQPIEGPELYGDTDLVPLASTIVVGDFNGDGRDEIAALLTDSQTVVFYSVDPKKLSITQTSTMKLPDFTMVSGQVALAAGRFRNQSPGVTNADLIIFGQIDKYDGHQADFGYSIVPILITANQDGTFTPQIVQQTSASVGTPYFRFNDKHGSSGAIAHAAQLAHWPQLVSEQLILGIKTNDGASYIEIGTFVQNDKLDSFDWESETERKYSDGPELLQNISIGNFDNLNSDGSHNPTLQVETYELVLMPITLTWQPHINIFDVNVPSPFSVPLNRRTDWLKQKSDNSSGVPLVVDQNSPPRADILVPGDTQGRSLRLGAPTIARITSQIQPDVVLAIPPMHVDWIPPKNLDLNQINQTGCNDPLTPCLLNVSVDPDPPPSVSALGFDTIFKFDSSSSGSAKQASTTSWGISVKQTASESASFNDGLENASESIKNTVKAAHDNTVKNSYDTYKGTNSNLSVTTGFTDHILYTERDMNVYYYPVLGCDTNCPIDTSKGPPYVVFSVPDNVTYNNADSSGQDWYQPVHEYGNVLSYPWNEAQLQNRFTDSVAPLTQTPTCMALGTGGTSATTTWNQGSSGSHSSGSTNSFSDELSMSYSEGAGVEGEDGAEFNYSLDIAANTSLNTLNESISSLSSSQGIAVTTPDFGYLSQCCNYGFGQYIFGLKSKKNPASENACTSGQISGCIPVSDPDGKPIDVGGTGPLFTGYIANPLNGNQNSNLNCSGNASWWTQIYTKPDVALNHPERWSWTRSNQSVMFNPADRTYPQNPAAAVPIDQQFYTMKGFYIAKKSAGGFNSLSLPSGPNLAVANADDALSLTTRVYNYSLVDTTAPVHVRFYGQLYCSANGSRAKSCINWKTGSVCNGGDLCGDSFQIGQDQIIQSIAGFESPDGNGAPNWRLASVDFLPTQFPAVQSGNVQMVFWVVAWMQDANGNPVAEMQDHGLTAVPASSLTQITQVATEEHSNNVGMYPVHQFFQILPAGAPPQAVFGRASLKSLSLSTSAQVSLGQRTKVVAALETTGGQMKSVNIAYYDGDPTKDGKLVDVQKIAYMDPDVSYYHRTFFLPSACGAQTLYARAWIANSPAVQASATTNVSLDSVNFVQALINSTKNTGVTDSTLRSTLLTSLDASLQAFQQGQTETAEAALGTYIQELMASSGSGVSTDGANRLIGQSNVILGCGPKGFSLSALPSSATVTAGGNTSYSIAATPTGGFNGTLSLACTGAPEGANCAISNQSITLDGVSQSRVTVNVTTSPQVHSAGMIGGLPSSWIGRLGCFLMLLMATLAITILQRARIRYPLLGCILLIMLSSISGCGSNSNHGTPSGYYPLTVQATSGNATQTIRMSLHVQ